MRKRPVAVLGLGLVGGSLARGLRRRGHRVLGYDRPAAWEKARSARAVEGPRRSLEATVAEAEIVFLAAPPRANLELLRRIVWHPGLIVTDVSSVKGPICRLARRLRLPCFVGGHPMAGNEGSGFGASSPTLFEGRTWVLTPRERERPEVRTLAALARSLGARPVLLSPVAHDRAVAFLSHLPQVVAYALLEAARRDPVAGRHLALAGPAFRDMTRLARSPRALWGEILEQNAPGVERAVRAFLVSLRRSPRSAI